MPITKMAAGGQTTLLRRLALAVILVAATTSPAGAQEPRLPPPPPGYEWQWCADIKGAFLRPDGWFFKQARQGTVLRPSFRMFGAPYTGYLTLAFLAAVLVLMAFDTPVGTWTVASIAIIVPLLVAGWYLARWRILAIAAERDGSTGPHPVIAHHALAGAAERAREKETADV